MKKWLQKSPNLNFFLNFKLFSKKSIFFNVLRLILNLRFYRIAVNWQNKSMIFFLHNAKSWNCNKKVGKGRRTKCTENGLMIKNCRKIFFLYFRICKLKIRKKNVRKMDSFYTNTCQSFDYYMYFNGKMLILAKCFFSSKTLW